MATPFFIIRLRSNSKSLKKKFNLAQQFDFDLCRLNTVNVCLMA